MKRTYLNSHGFYEGEVDADYIAADFPHALVDAEPPAEVAPRFFAWAWGGDAWVLSPDNRGRLWYDPDNTELEYRGDAPNAQPPAGYVDFVNGIGKVASASEVLRKAKGAQWAAIKQARTTAEYAGFTWDGSTFDSDALSQNRITGAVTLAQLSTDFVLDWTLLDNTTRTLNQIDMLQVGAALGSHVATQFARGQARRAAIEVATTPEEVLAVAW